MPKAESGVVTGLGNLNMLLSGDEQRMVRLPFRDALGAVEFFADSEV